MRLGAAFTFIIFFELASGRTLQWRRQLAPDSQHVIGNNPLGDYRHSQQPISLTPPKRLGQLKGFVALGDSYSAGIGTGVDGKEEECRRGLGSHVELIAADLLASHGGRNSSTFQFLSCTGATTQDLISGGSDSQVDTFNTTLPVDLALLSIGGNDLGFFDVINACVFRFYNFYSGTCEAALANAKAQIEGEEFDERLDIIIMEILDKVRWEKKPSFFITITGYARFFNELTDECDDMSFGIWWNGPKLKKDLRINMNAMVLTVNAKIRKTVDLVNSRFTEDKVIFIDYDEEFDGHRFCEQGVREPDYERKDTWFFLIGGPDNGTQSKHASDLATLPPNSAWVDPASCLEPAQKSGDWGKMALCYMAMANQEPNLQFSREEYVAENSMWYVPTYYGKTFHPRSLGHEVIRDKIYEAWRERARL